VLTRGSAAGVCLLLGAAYIPTSADAAAQDFAMIELTAAAPLSYDHRTGGGAYNERVVGNGADVQTVLDGSSNFACGEYVSYFVTIKTNANPIDENQPLRFDLHLSADTWYSSGVGFVDIGTVAVNYGTVQNGKGPNGTDSGIEDDGGSAAVVVSKFWAYNNGTPAPGPFLHTSELIARILVNDLEANEQVVVRVDGLIGCQPGANPSGYLDAYLSNASTKACGCSYVPLTGNIWVPMNNAGNVTGGHGPTAVVKKTVTTAGGSCPGSEQIEATAGETVKYCYDVINAGTGALLNTSLVDDNGTPGNPADDFAVTLNGLTDVNGGALADDLAAGATATGQALVVADLRGGYLLTNTAKATGTSSAGTTVSGTDTASVVVSDPPASLALEVKASVDSICGNSDDADPLPVQAGTTVHFCYHVTNTGAITVSNIAVTDDIVTVPSALSLPPGESGYLVSDGVVASGDLSDLAVANGTTGLKSVSSNLDSADVIVPFSDLSIGVTASLDEVCGNSDDTELAAVLTGTTVYYCYQVTNVGLTSISAVTVTDPLATVNGTASIAPAQSYTFISAPTTATVDETHIASALGTDSYGFPVDSDQDTAGVDVVHPSLVIAKTANRGGTCPGSESVFALAGQIVDYCYTVTNTGDTTVEHIVVNDNGAVVSVGDLGPGQSGSGSTTVAAIDDINTPATASGTDSATLTAVQSPEDGAAIDVVHPALVTAVTVSLNGACPGQEVLNVLANTGVTWCYKVTNTGDTPVTSVRFEDDDNALANPSGTVTLEPGQNYTTSLADAPSADLTLTGVAKGITGVTDTFVQSNYDPANVNVVSPGVNIDVTVSTSGTCPGADAVAVPSGTKVTYCYEVSNLGDGPLSHLVIVDEGNNEIGTIPSLPAGGSTSIQSALTTVTGNNTETASVSATDQYGFPVSDTDSALVDALFANLHLVKDAPANATYGSYGGLPYTITVSNIGETTAVTPVVTDKLPSDVSFVSATAASGTCSYLGGKVTCTLANLAPNASTSITIVTTPDAPDHHSCGGGSSNTITNVAMVTSQTPESDVSDNSDSAVTHVSIGATRTIGYWGNRPNFVASCLAANNGVINLGFVTIKNETYDNEVDGVGGPDKDHRVETGLSMALGILNSNVAKFTNHQHRTSLGQARAQASRQVLAAICNKTLLGTIPSFNLTTAVQTLAGTNIQAILQVGDAADDFNNSGDQVSIGINPGPANPKFPWDDPTDPND
jgi:uncharacterized repeat protein (TIGR01451 family)